MTPPNNPPVEPIVVDPPAAPPAAPVTPPVVPPAAPPADPPVIPPQQDEPEGYVKTERYTGAVQKIQTLTSVQKELTDQLAAKSSEMEQLNSQLASKEAEANTSLGEKDGTITDLQGKLDVAQKDNSGLKALKMKVDAIKEMGRPDLLPIVEHLPDTTDAEQLKVALLAFATTMDDALKARDQQLLSGVIDTPTTPAVTLPQTAEAWVEHIENQALGTKEREDAMTAYGVWLQKMGAV